MFNFSDQPQGWSLKKCVFFMFNMVLIFVNAKKFL